MSLKKKHNAASATLYQIEPGEKTMYRQSITGKRQFALINFDPLRWGIGVQN